MYNSYVKELEMSRNKTTASGGCGGGCAGGGDSVREIVTSKVGSRPVTSH